MKYRKKPVVIEAIQLPFGGMNENMEAQRDLVAWLIEGGLVSGKTLIINMDGWTITTLEGDHLARWGDFIIKGIAGEFYPCKPDIFAQTYEPVDV